MSAKFDAQRAKAIGRNLFQKYDIYKSNILQPKQCYQLFSDFCYRILNIPNTPTMQQANSMHEVMDFNKDKKVTVADFQSLAVRYLCGQGGFSSNSFTKFSSDQRTSNVTNTSVTKTTVVTSHAYSNTKRVNLTPLAQKRLDVVRRLFEKFDKDKSGYLTQDEVPFILQQTYKQMGQAYKPTKQDVRSYMVMVDKDKNGKITLEQFQDIVLQSLRKAGFQVYHNQIY